MVVHVKAIEDEVKVIEEQDGDSAYLKDELLATYEKIDQWWDERDRIFMKCI